MAKLGRAGVAMQQAANLLARHQLTLVPLSSFWRSKESHPSEIFFDGQGSKSGPVPVRSRVPFVHYSLYRGPIMDSLKGSRKVLPSPVANAVILFKGAWAKCHSHFGG